MAPVLNSLAPLTGGLRVNLDITVGAVQPIVLTVSVHEPGQAYVQKLYRNIADLDGSNAPNYTVDITGLPATPHTVMAQVISGQNVSSPPSNELVETPGAGGGGPGGLTPPQDFTVEVFSDHILLDFATVPGAAVYYALIGYTETPDNSWVSHYLNTTGGPVPLWQHVPAAGVMAYLAIVAGDGHGGYSDPSDVIWVILPDQWGYVGDTPNPPAPPNLSGATPGNGEMWLEVQ
ncbi:MAG: hypothetical protein R3F17_14235 [Planctomycetota bacterium]